MAIGGLGSRLVGATGVLNAPSGARYKVDLTAQNVAPGGILSAYMQIDGAQVANDSSVSAVIVYQNVVVGHLVVASATEKLVGLTNYAVFQLQSASPIASIYAGATMEVWATIGQAFNGANAPGATSTTTLQSLATNGYITSQFTIGSVGLTMQVSAPSTVSPGDVPSAQVSVTETSGAGTAWTLKGVWMYQSLTLGSWNAQSGSGSRSVTMTSNGGISAANAGRTLTAIFTLTWAGGQKTQQVSVRVQSASTGGGSPSGGGTPTGGGTTSGGGGTPTGGGSTGGTGGAGGGTGASIVPFLSNLTTTDYVLGGLGVTAAVVLVAVIVGSGARRPMEGVEYVPEYAPEGEVVA